MNFEACVNIIYKMINLNTVNGESITLAKRVETNKTGQSIKKMPEMKRSFYIASSWKILNFLRITKGIQYLSWHQTHLFLISTRSEALHNWENWYLLRNIHIRLLLHKLFRGVHRACTPIMPENIKFTLWNLKNACICWRRSR